MRLPFFACVVGVGVAALTAAPSVAGEFQIGVYGGWNGSHDSDVNFTGPGTDLTFQSVPWDGLSFTFDGEAPYYGARFTYWPDALPNWGFMFDLTHAKVRAKEGATVTYSGTASGSDQIGHIFDRLEFTDGFTLLTVNGMYRFEPMDRFRPYVGAGLGINIPHVEVTGAGGGPASGLPTTFEYTYGGLAAQALAGVDIKLTKHISLFTEYKFSWAGVNAPLSDPAYRIRTDLFTHHVLVGASVNWGGSD
jgi:lipid A oxidase